MSDDLYKVIWTDGYDRETVAQHVVAERMGITAAKLYCGWLRNHSTWDGNWWKVLPQDAPVWRGMAEFV